MADTTVRDPYPVATNSRGDVDAIAQNHVDHGALSSVVTQEGTDWIVTTVWAGEDTPSGSS